ncbi:SPX and EXS domain-containing protein [Tanacetum coccineum]
MDAFTSSMCVESWGRIGFTRALIEVCADKELKEEVVIAVPIVDGTGDSTGYSLTSNDPPQMNSSYIDITNTDALDADNEEVEEVLASWNIRVMNQAPKQKEVRQVIFENNLCLCAILESHVVKSNLQDLCSKVFKNRNWTSNGFSCDKGSRIILGWNPDIINVVVIAFDAQGCVTFKSVEAIEVSDVNSTGLRFTWNQKPNGEDGILKKLDRIMANLEFNTSFVGSSLHELDEAQKAIDSDHSNIELREEKAAYLNAFHDALLMKERLFMQKAKVEWLHLGDANTTYFHKVVKSQASRNHIDSITNTNGDCVYGDHVPLAFINHYTEFLGQQGHTPHFNSTDLFCNQLYSDVANYMVCEVFDKEVRDAIFSMGDNKAPGPDGYSAAFFKEVWDIITVDVIKAIKEFFTNEVLLKELNHTIIALIPKLTDLVSLNQSVFVPERRISDNILLTQELMHNYHLDRGTPRCAFKVDIQKAYDMVDWKFLHEVLVGLVSTLGKRGLRQGDPMYPYLFTLVMEVLTLIDVDLARVITDSLKEFKNALDLTPKGKLSVKYLGVPLVPSRLLYRDCSELLERVKRRINDWKNKSLSLAERVQLIREMRKGKAKVAWEAVCLPKKEGRLGIRRLELFNKALISSHIWSLLTRKESLWVKRIHSYKLNGRTFWEVPLRGDGGTAFAWFDNWCLLSPLTNFISNQDIYSVGLRLNAKVSDIINSGSWGWPNDWILKYHLLVNIAVRYLSNVADRLIWRNLLNVDSGFLVATTWDRIRPRSNEVDWFHVVWEHMKLFTGISNTPSDLSSIVDFLIPLLRCGRLEVLFLSLFVLLRAISFGKSRMKGFS